MPSNAFQIKALRAENLISILSIFAQAVSVYYKIKSAFMILLGLIMTHLLPTTAADYYHNISVF